MVNLEATPDIEETPLMSSRPDGEHLQRTLPISANPNLSPHRVLPVAFLSAIAMSSTAATAYYAYASLLCRDPSHCEGDETSRYAGFVAVTTCVSNTLGVIALGPLQTMVKKHRILGIVLWQGTRSMSPIMLLTGGESHEPSDTRATSLQGLSVYAKYIYSIFRPNIRRIRF